MTLSSLVENTCRIGQGEACCRYLAADAKGFCCLKHTSLKAHLDSRVATGTINARGDNCEGKPESESL